MYDKAKCFARWEHIIVEAIDNYPSYLYNDGELSNYTVADQIRAGLHLARIKYTVPKELKVSVRDNGVFVGNLESPPPTAASKKSDSIIESHNHAEAVVRSFLTLLDYRVLAGPIKLVAANDLIEKMCNQEKARLGADVAICRDGDDIILT